MLKNPEHAPGWSTADLEEEACDEACDRQRKQREIHQWIEAQARQLARNLQVPIIRCPTMLSRILETLYGALEHGARRAPWIDTEFWNVAGEKRG